MEKHLYYYPNHATLQAVTDQKNIHNVIYCDNEAHVHYDYDRYAEQYLTFNITTGGTIIWKAKDSTIIKTISYKLNDGNWTEITSSTEGISINVSEGDKIMFKGNNTTYGLDYGVNPRYNTFGGSTAYFNIEGNIMSLINGDSFTKAKTLESTYTFFRIFYKAKVRNAENLILPATVLINHCYGSMFEDCTVLKTPPKLPATKLATMCYGSMFSGCTSLTTAPQLRATTLVSGCYLHMFYGCGSLITAPELPATKLAERCYVGMFQGCGSLTTAPALPATTLADGCYSSMFYGCIGLRTAPQLPATTLAESCYRSMFIGCQFLATAPELPATTLMPSCYMYMFRNCKKLNSIICLATDISANSCTTNWVDNVASSGTFTKAASMTGWTTGANGIPDNWTVQNASN